MWVAGNPTDLCAALVIAETLEAIKPIKSNIMKNYILGALTAIAILITSGFIKDANKLVTPDKEWTIAPRWFTLQEGITKDEAREWLENEYLLLYREFPGWNAMVGEPVKSSGWGNTTNNNAKEKGDFVLIYFFDSKETLNHYWPEDGSMSDDVVNGIARHQSTFDKLLGKYFVQDKYQMEEYSMFASSK